MLDFEVQRCTRKCFVTERELGPGEEYYSVLVAEGAEVVRRDYSLAAWEGAPDQAIGLWKSRIPETNARKLNWAPNDVMLEYFQQLDVDSKANIRYLLALLLVRRRVFRWETTEPASGGTPETMVVYCPKIEQEFRVAVTTPGANEVMAIQNELVRLLFGMVSSDCSWRFQNEVQVVGKSRLVTNGGP